MARRVMFVAKGKVTVEPFELPALGVNDVRVNAICSLISPGTEGIILNQLYAPNTHWDQWLQGKWPWHPGYALIGDVAEVGSAVTSVKKGDRVALPRGHASAHIVPASRCIPVPSSLDPQAAVWFALGKVAFMGARAAQYFLGDSALIVGAGPIGQMSTRWAQAAGAQRIIVVDPIAARLKLATKGGATATIAKPIADCRAEIEAATDGQLPNKAIDATGNAAVFAAVLGLTAARGTVVVLGDTGTPANQHLTSDVITKGLKIVGAHGSHEDAEWPGRRIFAMFFDLLAKGRFDWQGLNSHVVAGADAPEAYRLMNERRGETMGLVLDWTK